MAVTIYKRGQGYTTRVMAAIFVGLVVLLGAYWMWEEFAGATWFDLPSIYISAGVATLFAAVAAGLGAEFPAAGVEQHDAAPIGGHPLEDELQDAAEQLPLVVRPRQLQADQRGKSGADQRHPAHGSNPSSTVSSPGRVVAPR